MESDLRSTSQWIQFFRNAGLPPNVAANYALIFSDNRIQQNMLMDLSKEYLYDMGIKLMGDVIAILKYAKEFHNQLAQEKIMKGSPIFLPKKSTPATRTLQHYTRPLPPPESPPTKVEKLKRKAVMSVASKPMVVSPTKKPRRVLPEEEGGYTIKMPVGSTERSKKILEQSVKKSVFDRLGDSDVSSSTDIKESSQKSVFHRLGPATNEVITSSTVQPKKTLVTYHGVLKNTAVTPVRKVIGPIKTQRPARNVIAPGKATLVQRLGNRVAVAAPSKRTVINNPRMGLNHINKILEESALPQSNVRRLGLKKTIGLKNTTPNRTILSNRLGLKQAVKRGSVQPKILGRQSTLQSGSVFQRLGV